MQISRSFRLTTKKHERSALLSLCEVWLVDSPHKGTVTRNMFSFGDLIRELAKCSEVHLAIRKGISWDFIVMKYSPGGPLGPMGPLWPGNPGAPVDKIRRDNIWSGKQLFCCLFYCFTYILMPHNMIILYFRLPYFHVSNNAFIST